MDKVELERLRGYYDSEFTNKNRKYFEADILALLDHIDALEGHLLNCSKYGMKHDDKCLLNSDDFGSALPPFCNCGLDDFRQEFIAAIASAVEGNKGNG